MDIAESWFCAQRPIFVLFLRFVFGQDVQDLQQKYRPTTLKIQQYISLYTWGTFIPVFTKPILSVCC